MGIHPTMAQLFAVCVLSAAVDFLADDSACGVRTVCGVSIVLTMLRLIVGILG